MGATAGAVRSSQALRWDESGPRGRGHHLRRRVARKRVPRANTGPRAKRISGERRWSCDTTTHQPRSRDRAELHPGACTLGRDARCQPRCSKLQVQAARAALRHPGQPSALPVRAVVGLAGLLRVRDAPRRVSTVRGQGRSGPRARPPVGVHEVVAAVRRATRRSASEPKSRSTKGRPRRVGQALSQDQSRTLTNVDQS
jgi:hypothetical protein